MLSRSSSHAATNLRRTQSTQSIQRRSSAHSLIDPIAVNQHAIVAATLAYERGHGHGHGKENFRYSEQQPPQQLGRRRSCRTSGFEGEGSHFKEGPTPRRQSSKRGSNASNTTTHNARSRRGTMSGSGVSAQDFVPHPTLSHVPSVDTVQEETFKQHRSSISVHKLRKAKSMYTPSSTHVHASSIEEISFGPPQRPPPLPPPLEETVTSFSELDVTETIDFTCAPMALTRVNLENIAPRPTIPFTPAFNEVQTQKIRHRASLMLTPFKKRKSKLPFITPPPATPDPDMRFASIVRSPGAHIETTPRFDRRKTSNEMKKYGSITSRIRSVFRKPSASQILPVQQVNASRQYFGDSSTNHTMTSGNRYNENATTSQVAFQPPRSISYDLTRTMSPAHSDVTATTRSRVTSWADSTIAGTTLGHSDDTQLAIIEEETPQPIMLSQKDSKYGSFNLFRRIRRASKADMEASFAGDEIDHEPSLSGQERRAKSRSSRGPSRGSSRTASGALSTLPSQINKTTITTKTTVRAVHPDDEPIGLRHTSASSSMPSEAGVPDPFSTDGYDKDRDAYEAKNVQSVAEEAPRPTEGQIEARIRRSNERWQEPLAGVRSLFCPRGKEGVSPNRLPRHSSVNEGVQSGRPSSPEDMFAEIREPLSSRSMNAISPSLYSNNNREQEGLHELSALPSTPMLDPSGTAVIITSHPVVTYSVGSPKKSEMTQARKTSKDWRNWLHHEVQDLGTPPPDDLSLRTEFIEPHSGSDHHREGAQDDDFDETFEHVEDFTADLSSSYALPSIEWKPNQPPKITQHTSESSIPSTTSARSHLRTHSSISEEAIDDTHLPSNHSLASEGRGRSTSSRPRKMSSRLLQEDRPSSRLHDIHERPMLVDRPSSRMNERFPFIETSRPQSRISRRSSTPAQSMNSFSSRPTMVQKIQSAKEKNKENSTPSPTQSLPIKPTRARPVIRRPISTLALQRSQSSVAQYTTNEPIISTPTSASSQRLASHLPRPVPSPYRAATSLGNHHSRDVFVKQGNFPGIEADNTLANIVKGPYRETASPRPLSIRKVTSYSRENSPLKENSAPVTPRGTAPDTPTSGQRLAEQFLNARRFREDMRVMSPREGSPMSTGEFSPAFL